MTYHHYCARSALARATDGRKAMPLCNAPMAYGGSHNRRRSTSSTSGPARTKPKNATTEHAGIAAVSAKTALNDPSRPALCRSRRSPRYPRAHRPCRKPKIRPRRGRRDIVT